MSHQAMEGRKYNGSKILIGNIGRVHRRGRFFWTNLSDSFVVFELLLTF